MYYYRKQSPGPIHKVFIMEVSISHVRYDRKTKRVTQSKSVVEAALGIVAPASGVPDKYRI